MGRRVLLVRHGDDPPDDRAVTWLSQAGYDWEVRRPFRGETLGRPDTELAGTVIYGGQYNAYDTTRHVFLNEEYRWLGACLDAGVPTLGICQGAQMIAHHLGAWAGPLNPEVYEFGYYQIDPTPEGAGFLDTPLWVAQSHHHTFDLPEGAVRLAGNATYPNQAVRFRDNVYGLQFHPEITIEGFRRWQNQPWAHYGKPGAQTREDQTRLMIEHDEAQARWFYGFLDKLLGPAA